MKRIALLIVGLLIGALIILWFTFYKNDLPEVLPTSSRKTMGIASALSL